MSGVSGRRVSGARRSGRVTARRRGGLTAAAGQHGWGRARMSGSGGRLGDGLQGSSSAAAQQCGGSTAGGSAKGDSYGDGGRRAGHVDGLAGQAVIVSYVSGVSAH